MPSTPDSDTGPGPRADRRLSAPRLPFSSNLRGPAVAAAYLRSHLYGAAVGRSLLDRCASAVSPTDRARLLPLRDQFDGEIDMARRLLSQISPLGTPGRRVLRFSSGVALSFLPAGPMFVDPLTRLAALEALRTLVVAKRSMWVLLADSWVADSAATRAALEVLADQAIMQEELLEELRRNYGQDALQ